MHSIILLVPWLNNWLNYKLIFKSYILASYSKDLFKSLPPYSPIWQFLNNNSLIMKFYAKFKSNLVIYSNSSKASLKYLAPSSKIWFMLKFSDKCFKNLTTFNFSSRV